MESRHYSYYLLVGVLFLIAYALTWWLGAIVFNSWVSPMHWLIPIAGFFLAFAAFDWIAGYFESGVSSWIFPVVIIPLSLLAFYISQFLYWCNAFTPIRELNSSCGGAGVNQAIDFAGKQFVELLIRDAFFYFALAVLLAWVAKVVVLHALKSPSTVPAKRKSKKAD